MHQMDPYEEDRIRNTERILNSLSKFDVEDSYCLSIGKKSATLQICDQIYDSFKTYAVFKCYCVARMRDISLVAYIDRTNKMTNAPYCCPMSTFKEGGIFLLDNYFEYHPKRNCFHMLYEQILKIDPNKIRKGAVIPFEVPIHVKGQISRDRTDFGSNIYGLNKKYGDCSLNLYLIGIMVE